MNFQAFMKTFIEHLPSSSLGMERWPGATMLGSLGPPARLWGLTLTYMHTHNSI